MFRSKDEEFCRPEKRFSEMVAKLKVRSACWLDEVERDLEGDGRELNRELVQGWLDHIGIYDIGASLKLKNGEELRHRRVAERNLYTRYGKVVICRMGYSMPESERVFPLDIALNLPDSAYSYEVQKFISQRVARGSFQDALKLTQEITGVRIGSRQAVEIVESGVKDFDLFYKVANESSRERGKILVLTTDGKGIVMRSEGLREETLKRAQKATKKMRTRLSKGEKANRKRMAQVASLYTIEQFCREPRDVINELARKEAYQKRPKPKEKRVWASVEKDTKQVICELFEEAQKRDPKHNKDWVVLVDGQKHQMRTIKAVAKRNKVKNITIIVDLIHVIEYLWLAARVFFEEASIHCECWVEDKLGEILQGNAGKVAGSIRISAAKKKLNKEQLKVINKSSGYLANLKQYLKYKDYLKNGFPIATGVIEGACRYLIKDRMDITGARWTLSGAEAVLKLRSLVTSEDFDAYWSFHLKQEHQRNHLEKIGNLSQFGQIASS